MYKGKKMNKTNDIAAIVMASGLSRRMGEDKLKLPFRGKMLYQHIVDIISELPFKEKIIVTSKDYIAEYSKGKNFTIVMNPEAYKGQSLSIIKGLEKSSESKGYMFFVADQPFLKKETILHLIQIFDENSDKITLPFFCGIKGNPVIFPHRLKKDLLNIKGDQGGSVVIKKEWDESVKIDFNHPIEGLDIDTMENYNKYKES